MKGLFLSAMLFVTSSIQASDFKTVENAIENNSLEQAEQHFDILPNAQKDSIDGKILSGRILLLKDETEEAFDHFEALQEDHTNNVDVNYYLGVSAVIMAQKASVFSKLGYAKDFIRAMEKTIELKPDHLEALEYLIGFHLNAPGIAGGDKDKALMFAEQTMNADEVKGYQKLALVYLQTEKQPLAFETMAKGLEKYPENSDLYLARGINYVNQEDWALAREDIIKAVEFAQDDKQKSMALYQQGKIAVQSGEAFELGIKSLKSAQPIADDKYKPWVDYRLAQLYLETKQLEQAKLLANQIDYQDDDELKGKVKKLKKKIKKTKS